MNFFQAQKKARHNTGLLLLLFLLAVAMIIAAIYLCVVVFAPALAPGVAPGVERANASMSVNWEILGAVAGVVVAVIVVGMVFKWMRITHGRHVAESMGGRLVPHDTMVAQERQLINIVEEMSIASGVPMPLVYIMPEEGINAFAAGTSINTAVIGVTQGALNTFSRDEMQGVVAHEFSHILNGDMRLNIRLLAIIGGITFIGLIGYTFLRFGAYGSMTRYRSSSSRSALPMILFGLALVVIGFIGTLFGNMIRSAVSRQREFLADASAVQFTRNPLGIAGALEKIGVKAGLLQHEKSVEYAHMFFANGAALGFSNLFDSHPPIATRIRSILPDWDGESSIAKTAPPVTPTADSASPAASGFSSSASASATSSASSNLVPHIIACLGTMQPVSSPGNINDGIPQEVVAALECSYSARALIYAMLLHAPTGQQADHLRQHADVGVYDLTMSLYPAVSQLPPKRSLDLLQRALPTLRLLSPRQYERFVENLSQLILADDCIDLFEWSLMAVVEHSLGECFGEKTAGRADADDYAYVLSILARMDPQQDAHAAFDHAVEAIMPSLRYRTDDFAPGKLFDAMQRSSRLSTDKKERLVQMLVRCAAYNDTLGEQEEVILRAYLMILDCPCPQIAR